MRSDLLSDRARILIVDDHLEILDFIADDLEESYEVATAVNGKEALEYLGANDVDLIVSDVIMPLMNGYELCTKIKENVYYSHIPFIMLTAKNSMQSKIKGLEYGADAYIEKPFAPDFLQAQINSLLRNRRHVHEHYKHIPSMPIDSVAYNKSDQAFLRKLNLLILDNISEASLCVDTLADHMCMSRTTLYRKIKVLSDLSPNELINITRLKRAAQLLLEGEYKIYEISNILGFSTPSHFTRNFHKQFGISPKEYIADNQRKN